MRNLRSGMFPFAILNKDHHESRKNVFGASWRNWDVKVASIQCAEECYILYTFVIVTYITWPRIYISISCIYWCEERGLFTRPVCELYSCTILLSLPPFGPIEWFFQISSQWESQKNRLHLSISVKSSFHLPAFERSRSCRTASGCRSSMRTWARVRGGCCDFLTVELVRKVRHWQRIPYSLTFSFDNRISTLMLYFKTSFFAGTS